MGWWAFIPVLLTALLVVFVPGFLVALATRRPLAVAVLLAPVLSFALIGAGAILLSVVGIAWTPASFTALTGCVVIAAALMTAVVRRVNPAARLVPPVGRSDATAVWALAGSLLGAVLLTVQLVVVLGSPEVISQSYDNIFHLNAVRRIAESGDASTLTLNSLATGGSGGELSVYPAGWHGAVALVFSALESSVPEATNAVTIAVAAFAWPTSMAYLTSVIWPGRRLLAAAGGAVSASFLAYPGLMLMWGVLYPNLLSYALLPVLLAFIMQWTRAVLHDSAVSVLGRTGAVAVGAVAVSIAHPNGLTSAAVLALPLLMFTAWDELKSEPRVALRTLRVRGILLAVVICLAIWVLVRPSAAASTWPPKLPSGQATGEFLTNSFNGNIAAVTVSALVLIGAAACVRQRRSRWLVASWALVGVLWIVVASLSPGTVRWLLTGPWYNDSFRLAALTVIPSTLLAAFGLVSVARRAYLIVRRRSRLRSSSVGSRRWGVVLAGALIVMLPLTPASRGASESVAREFLETPDSLVITEDEQNVLDHVAAIVPPDEVIAVNPWEGSALAYALADREVTQFHTLGATASRYAAIPEGLNEVGNNPDVCEQVNEGNVRWYLRFEDTLGIGDWALPLFEGFEGVVESGTVRPAFVSGDVGLYEIVGCEP